MQPALRQAPCFSHQSNRSNVWSWNRRQSMGRAFYNTQVRARIVNYQMHARTYLRVIPTHYDMIVSEPSHPWVPGVANLFTREFFRLGRDRLNEDGIFVQWLQIYQLSTDSLRSVLATFQETFPHVLVFRVEGAWKGKDLLLVGSKN